MASPSIKKNGWITGNSWCARANEPRRAAVQVTVSLPFPSLVAQRPPTRSSFLISYIHASRPSTTPRSSPSLRP